MSIRQNHAGESQQRAQVRGRWRPLVGGAGVVLLSATLAANVAHALTKEEADRIDEGFRIFTEETFDGNGRTCGTCHIPEVNYNIFPSAIQKMGQKDRDLVFATTVPGLENIDLVRSRALFNISGNAESFLADEPEHFADDDAGHPVFRGSMGIQALEITSTNVSSNFPGTPLLPPACSQGVEGQLRQQGWSGDAPPGTPRDLDDPEIPGIDTALCHVNHGNFDPKANGSTRVFANGAIAQHNTKSLERIEGVDFRFATDVEANALEAFQNWLGRRPLTSAENTQQGTTGRNEFDIARLNFTDDRIDRGRDHYLAPAEFTRAPAAGNLTGVTQNLNSGAGCNGCHTNGGANTGLGPPGAGQGGSGGVGGPNNRGQNTNINTEVELGSDDIGLQVVGFALPHDEGASDSFGPRPSGGPDFDEAFNIQSIIEAPRKEAWFHNHRVVGEFEDAIAFYITNDFRQVDSEEDLAGAGNFTDYLGTGRVAVALTSEEVMRFGNASKSLGTISFPKGDGIEHLGAFLRALSAYYSLRDCQRLVQEAIDRIGVGASPDLPVRHCQFNLADVRKVLNGSKLKPKPYGALALQALPLSNELKEALKKAVKKDQMDRLNAVLAKLGSMREQIATVTSPTP